MEELLLEKTGLMQISYKSDDKLLVDKFRRTKDEKCFQVLVAPHLHWLKRLLASVFNGNASDMDDAMQEVLIGFYSDCIKFKDTSSFKTFFYSYARHKAIDYLRKISRYNKKHDYRDIDDCAEFVSSPESEYIRTEARNEIARSLLLLDPESRLLLTMKDCEDFSIDEISRITGVNPGTIKSRLHRTREKLAKYLKGRIR